jgi:hypothetical protein
MVTPTPSSSGARRTHRCTSVLGDCYGNHRPLGGYRQTLPTTLPSIFISTACSGIGVTYQPRTAHIGTLWCCFTSIYTPHLFPLNSLRTVPLLTVGHNARKVLQRLPQLNYAACSCATRCPFQVSPHNAIKCGCMYLIGKRNAQLLNRKANPKLGLAFRISASHSLNLPSPR